MNETGSDWVSSLVVEANDVYIAGITAVEVVAALTRRQRGGTFPVADARTAIARFKYELLYRYRVVDLNDEVLALAIDLAEQHSLRGYDAVQLAAAHRINHATVMVGLPRLTVLSADRELTTAARAEGLLVDDPNAHP